MFHPRQHGAAILRALGAAIVLTGGALAVQAQEVPAVVDLPPPIQSLKDVPLPAVPGIEQYIRDRNAAIALGKAFFWDMQVGSDGQACASCHFAAGVDNRLKNQLNPGLPGGDHNFNPTFSSGTGANLALKAQDYPFHRLSDVNDRESTVMFDTNDITSSQGTFEGMFNAVIPRVGDECSTRNPDEFVSHGLLLRRVAGRNAPSAVNAVFYHRNFWDGRANNVFNGVNPFGKRDVNARVLMRDASGALVPAQVALVNSSLASQAVGPALSDFEMSCAQKAFRDLGRKMMSLRPLALQDVHAQDSTLGIMRMNTGKGLRYTYAQLIRMAFQPQWLASSTKVDGYTQIENNFALFWGLAIQAYESTLVSDDAPFDRYAGSAARGIAADPNALTAQQIRGLEIFRTKGNCVACHKGAEFTGAAVAHQQINNTEGELEAGVIERMMMGNLKTAVYDNGFYNIGVRPTSEDRGVGGSDPFGNPLSFSRQWLTKLQGGSVPDSIEVNPCNFEARSANVDCSLDNPAAERVAVDGSFKTPTLRNIALTRPYFHNGGQFTLEQVVAFYNRGGDSRKLRDANGVETGGDTSGLVDPSAPNGSNSNLDRDIEPLGLTAEEQADLVAFLRFGLTDRRVACDAGPFDHPSLRLPNGHKTDVNGVTIDANGDGKADDEFIDLPATGIGGRTAGQCWTNDDESMAAQ